MKLSQIKRFYLTTYFNNRGFEQKKLDGPKEKFEQLVFYDFKEK